MAVEVIEDDAGQGKVIAEADTVFFAGLVGAGGRVSPEEVEVAAMVEE